LTKAAEAGALSGARALWPLVLPVDTTGNVTPDCAQGVNVARTTATRNRVEITDLATGEVTAEAGKWNYTTKQFTPGISTAANAVRVTVSRANVKMILAQVLGHGPRNMSATAIAIMDYAQGIGCLPITLDDNAAFDSDGNVNNINVTCRMTPDPGDNAGWFTIPPASASAAQLKTDVNDLYTDNLRVLYENDWINLQNGADASVVAAVQDEFNKYMGADGSWTVVIPTVDTVKFGQDEQVVRFVGLRITEVKTTTSDKKVFGHLVPMCEVKGLPGGPKGGVLAPPKLVL
jgi:hypothetical protein